MKAPKIQPVLFTSKTYKNGEHPLMIRLTQEGIPKYISTTYTAKAENWDEQKCRVYEKKPSLSQKEKDSLKPKELTDRKAKYLKAAVLSNAKHINQRIENTIDSINEAIKYLEVHKKELTSQNIIQFVAGKLKDADSSMSFIEFADEEITKKLHGSPITLKNYKSTVNKLKAYIKDQLKKKDLKFSDFTEVFLDKYHVFLQGTGISNNTIWSELKNLKALMNKAVTLKHISSNDNPFLTFKDAKYQKPNKTKLSVDEIDKIINLKLEEKTPVWHARNYFMFSFYNAGMRISDVCQLRWSNIEKGYLKYEMNKTGHLSKYLLLPKAKEILTYYENEKMNSESFIFPLLDDNTDYTNEKTLKNHIASRNTIINKNLKILGKSAKIKSAITFHISRHSFADYARKKGISTYDISKMLGHSSLTITEAYLSSFDQESQDKSLSELFG
ncbi:site-specific recombinase XerD [Mucilaginibacter sp. SG538B]|uniref:site-specific integrase n=1 Tax=Mucilaginibacter sp. SG538B TaxID=2587021 RepID=UPI00159D723F|nr:site-specific integrase [Mucilaginibacter sp. SG538B]NVM63225.1 site-specific recombinase XerD [Mucilaginibacter sp. SG538B]